LSTSGISCCLTYIPCSGNIEQGIPILKAIGLFWSKTIRRRIIEMMNLFSMYWCLFLEPNSLGENVLRKWTCWTNEFSVGGRSMNWYKKFDENAIS
jgi:hypothetical protein